MSLRDDLLPVFDDVRATIQGLGLRRFSVILRRRIWDGQQAGEGNVTVEDIVLTPLPRVRIPTFSTDDAETLIRGSYDANRVYKIDRITPQYLNQNGSIAGGYTPDQLRMRVQPEIPNVDPVVILVGDDGQARECVQRMLLDDRAFGYGMIVQETDRKAVALVSLAITPSPAALTRPAKLQLVATATFEDGSTGGVTPLVQWVSLNPAVATVDLLGVASGVSAGSAPIVAQLRGIAAPPVTLTVA